MLKSLAQLLVALIPATEPTEAAFDVATLTCHQFIVASDQSRSAVFEEIDDRLGGMPGGEGTGRRNIDKVSFRLDLACLDAPDALVLQVVAGWRRPLGNAGVG